MEEEDRERESEEGAGCFAPCDEGRFSEEDLR